jgi:hypothetical protein
MTFSRRSDINRTRMRNHRRVPLSTLDKAVHLAHVLSRDLSMKDSKTMRSYHVFQALTKNDAEALAAFFIWKGGGTIVTELASQ